jgi:hypothetical protein
MISTMYPSRPLTRYDDPESQYTVAESVTGEYVDIDGESYEGTTANASEGYYPSLTYRYDMIQAAIDGTADGFVFFDPAPSVIEIACTGDISLGATGYDSQIRARNAISSMMYGGTYEDGYAPSGSGFADPCVKSELLRFASKRTVGYLDDIRESVNLAGYGGQDNGNLNGWIRGALDPSKGEITYDLTQSSNRSSSDSTYGEQYWTQKILGGSNCDCPVDCNDAGNPYDTAGGAASCCCIEVYRYEPQPGESCPCPNIDIKGGPRNSPSCETYKDCPCDTTHIIDVSNIINDCPNAPCKRSVSIYNACRCVQIVNPPGGLNTCESVNCLTCFCALAENPTLVQGCDQLELQDPNGNSAMKEKVDYSLILDMRNYKRSSPNQKNFIMIRPTGGKISDWGSVYEGAITNSRYAIFVQSGETILKPSVSVDALRTHSNKEVLRHLPNQYFTT